MLSRRHDVEEEVGLADCSALVGKLTCIGAALCDAVQRDDGAFSTVVPEIIISPPSGSLSIEDNPCTGENGLLCSLLNLTVDGNLLAHRVGLCIATDSNGEGCSALGTVRCGVGDAIDVAVVGLHGNLARSFTTFPLP